MLIAALALMLQEAPTCPTAAEFLAAESARFPARADGRPLMVVNPSWRRLERPRFPKRARDAGVRSGSVTLECAVNERGHLGPCRVEAEQPSDLGFAEEALRAASRSRANPRTLDDIPIESCVVFDTHFTG